MGGDLYAPITPGLEVDTDAEHGIRRGILPAGMLIPPNHPVIRIRSFLASQRVRAGAGIAAAAFGIAVLAAVATHAPRAPDHEHIPSNSQQSDGIFVQLAGTAKKCHTAVPGEDCYKDVSWAITDGIYAHPEWYEGLTNKSNFETFQAMVYKINSTKCPLPCNYAPPPGEKKDKDKDHHHKDDDDEEEDEDEDDKEAEKEEEEEHEEAPGGHEDVEMEKQAERQKHEDHKAEEACHTATKGEHCYKAVQWAMKDGISERPDWYKGLTDTSPFEEFQEQLHTKAETNCPKPCACHTAVFGERCYKHVLWVLKEGLVKHPEWYEGLSSTSRFEEVQQRLHEDKNTTCAKPCTPKHFGNPSLFCFSVFQSKGYERPLMAAQLQRRQGIFSCDEFHVVCDKPLTLGQGPAGPVVASVIPHTKVGISKDNTAANTLIFIHAWQKIHEDFRFRKHDWVLKVDPDAVIVPHRLRIHLSPHTGKKVYVKNCNKYPGSPNWPMMFGSLEAISQSAMWTYMEGADRCRNELEWEAWGEDLYLAECLDLLGCDSVNDYSIISDKVCMGVNCHDKEAAAFHAFKGLEEWFHCWDTVFK